MKQKLSIIAFGLLLVAASLAAADERPASFGFAPALPLERSDLGLAAQPPQVPQLARPVWYLHVDDDGHVDSISSPQAVWQQHIAYLDAYFKGFRFEPARRDGNKVASLLPIRVLLSPGNRYPDITFPVDFDSSISRQDLYILSLESNGYVLPEVRRFPSFHATMTLQDSLTSVPFTVIEMELDSTGAVLWGSVTHDQCADFGRQLETAAMYAEFSPLRYNGRAANSTAYLLVSYFPEVSYPTRPYVAEHRDSLALLRKFQLTMLPDTVGIARPAMPALFKGDMMRAGKGGMLPSSRIPVWVTVDTLGVARATRTDRAAGANQSFINDFITNLKFYPAVDFHGRPVVFRGLMTLSRGGRENVRIDYDWLENASVSAAEQ